MLDANMVEKMKISVGGGVEPPRPRVGARVGPPDDCPLFSFDYLVDIWTMRQLIGRI